VEIFRKDREKKHRGSKAIKKENFKPSDENWTAIHGFPIKG
jgi:hypothetical protein